MADWSEVLERVRDEYTLDVESPDEFAVTVSRGEGDAPRLQRVIVRRYEAWGREMVEVRSAFGEIGDYDPQGLLSDNLQLPIGAVALHEQFLVLVHKACLEDMSVEGVIYLVSRVSQVADILEEQGGTDRF